MPLVYSLTSTKCGSFGRISFWPVSIEMPVWNRKRKVERTRNRSCWADFKTTRNEVNNYMPNANTRTIRKSFACGSWFTNSSRLLPTSRVVYQPITHRNLWSIAYKTIIELANRKISEFVSDKPINYLRTELRLMLLFVLLFFSWKKFETEFNWPWSRTILSPKTKPKVIRLIFIVHRLQDVTDIVCFAPFRQRSNAALHLSWIEC